MAAVRCSADNEVSRRRRTTITPTGQREVTKRTLTKSNGGTSTERVFVFSSSAGRTSFFAIRFDLLENGQKITSTRTINSKMTSCERSQVATTKTFFRRTPTTHFTTVKRAPTTCRTVLFGRSCEARAHVRRSRRRHSATNQPITVYDRFGGKFDKTTTNSRSFFNFECSDCKNVKEYLKRTNLI